MEAILYLRDFWIVLLGLAILGGLVLLVEATARTTVDPVDPPDEG